MRLICPSCGAIASADVWQQDATIRQCLQIVAEMPSYVSRHVLAYLGCFRPAGSTHGLKWPKTYRLLLELKELVEQTYISWDRKPARPNQAKFWAQGIELVLERLNQGRLKLPLENHNYLRAIAYDIADQADRAGENARNQAIIDGSAPRGTHIGAPPPCHFERSEKSHPIPQRTPEMEEAAHYYLARLQDIIK